MPRSGWAREPWPLSLRVRSLCSATGEATAVRGPRTAKKKNVIIKQINFTNALLFQVGFTEQQHQPHLEAY